MNYTMLAVRASHGHETFFLPGLIASPYMQMIDPSMVGGQESGRDINSSLVCMTLKALVAGYSISGTTLNLSIFFESDDGTINAGANLAIARVYGDTDLTIQASITTAIDNFCSANSLPNPTIDWLVTTPTDLAAAIAAAASAAPADSALSLSIQTSTGAVGTQVSATRNAWVAINASVSTTANISGNAAEDLVVEVAPTNSATAGDWVEKARMGNSQALTLAITLQSVQVVKNQMFVFVPAGYYVKVRSTGISGTTSASISSARQTLI